MSRDKKHARRAQDHREKAHCSGIFSILSHQPFASTLCYRVLQGPAPEGFALWRERADVSRERDHVILRELLDSLFHQGACASRAAAVLELIELAHDVGW